MEGLGHLLLFAFLFWFSTFMVAPVMTDVTMAALCPGRDECSLAIYLTGLQQAVTYIYKLLPTWLIASADVSSSLSLLAGSCFPQIHCVVCMLDHCCVVVPRACACARLFLVWFPSSSIMALITSALVQPRTTST